VRTNRKVVTNTANVTRTLLPGLLLTDPTGGSASGVSDGNEDEGGVPPSWDVDRYDTDPTCAITRQRLTGVQQDWIPCRWYSSKCSPPIWRAGPNGCGR